MGRPHVAPRYRAAKAVARATSSFAVRIAAKYHLFNIIEQPDVAAIYIAPHRSMFDLPAGIVTFGKLDVTPLLVVSKPHLEKISTRQCDWNSLDLLPVDAGAGGRSALVDSGTAALHAGRSVAIMPEGRVVRSGYVHRDGLRTGAAHLATVTGAPVVILGSAGSEALWQRGKLTTFGSLRRPPVVVVCFEIVVPATDISSTHELISDRLAAAESEAHRRLATLQVRV